MKGRPGEPCRIVLASMMRVWPCLGKKSCVGDLVKDPWIDFSIARF